MAASSAKNSACLECHDGRQEILVPDTTFTAKPGDKRPLTAIPSTPFDQSVHGAMPCQECHQHITSVQPPHQTGQAEKIDCAVCHEKRLNNNDTILRNIENYRQSFHSRPNQDDPSIPNATCHECHDTHFFNIPKNKQSPEYLEWYSGIASMCGKCHDDALERYATSTHGMELLKKKNPNSPTCISCHTTHEIGGAHLVAFKLLSPDKCGTCHQKNLASYRRFYHGQATRLGIHSAAKCFDCHESHMTRPVKDPQSLVHPNNRLKTCKKCHDGKKSSLASSGFASFTPHAQPDDAKHHPQLWFAARFMHGLLWSVMLFFLTHSALWFYREWREGNNRPAIPTPLPVRHVTRFSPFWRLAHLLFALSVMILIMTGITLLYAHTPWALMVVRWLGNPIFLGSIHRIAALVMVSIFLLHLLILLPRLLLNREFAWFGPDSLLPNRKDFSDLRDMFRWFFGQGEKPRFDRWTYYEKFDYWAIFWGIFLIGGSGAILAWPQVAGSHFEGWIFNVALLLHGKEAFLAILFLFTIHFFNNHFRPDKFPPPEVVIFTGTQTLEALQRDHPAHIDRLQVSNELERLIVPPPSPLLIGSAKMLGLLLIVLGLGLLGLTLHGAWTEPTWF